ncbi:MAG: ThiF family adenylyltransferase [Phycisphaerales bacterium]
MNWSAPGFREITIADGTGVDGLIDRMPDFIGLTVDARAVLADTKVLVVGVGSVGGRIAEHAARCRIGGIDLIDPKSFSANFDTQPIRKHSDVGQSKASLVGRWVKSISPGSVVRVFKRPVQSLSWLDLDRYDVVLAGTDNLPVEVYLGTVCRSLGIPLIYAAVHGPSLTSQLRIFMNRDDAGPCVFCGFSRDDRDRMSRGVKYSCDPGADPHGSLDPQPTVSVSPLCSVAAATAVLELLRMRIGLGPTPQDCLRELNAYGGTAVTAPLTRNVSCPVDHAVLERVKIDRPLNQCTLRECAAAAGTSGDAAIARVCFAVDDGLFVWVLTCGHCGKTQKHNRFIDRRRLYRPLPGRCTSCGHRSLAPHPFYSFDGQIPAGKGGLVPCLDVPLRSLDAEGRGVVIRTDDRAVLVQSHHKSNGSTP